MNNQKMHSNLIFKYGNQDWGLRTEWSRYIEAIEGCYGGGAVGLVSGIDWTLMSNAAFPERWIGFFHQPFFTSKPLIPLSEVKEVLSQKGALKSCMGIFVLTKWQRDFLLWQKLDVPVSTVFHPVSFDCPKWSWEEWIENRRVTFVGRWLRQPQIIQDLVCNGVKKYWLCKQNTAVYGIKENGTVERLPYLSNAHYDMWLSKSIIMTHIVDAAANNVVMECIARNTPLLINWHSSAVEYLGGKYPLYYSNIREAGWKASDPAMVLAAHDYLKEMDKSNFSTNAFVEAVGSSEVFENIRRSKNSD